MPPSTRSWEVGPLAAARQGGCVAIYAFDEGLGTLFSRGKALGMDVTAAVQAARAIVQRVDPAEMGPGEFAWKVRHAVKEKGARVVVIDSLNGYLQSMPEHSLLTVQMHELLTYLAEMGVVTILVAQHGMIGNMQSTVDVSYLSDTFIMLRFFEAGGRVRKAISVLKKRSGQHEDTIREMSLARGGLRVGEVLCDFHGS